MTSEAETVVRSWEQPIETGDVPESGTQFDAIVVGGGPGGSSAAGYLAKSGARVCCSRKMCGPATKYVATP